MTDLNATLKVTFKLPRLARSKDEPPSKLSVKDCDFVETEVLRQFFINTQRIVDFDFFAYPEDQYKGNEYSFVGLHYHAVVRSKNNAKFIAVALRKYKAVLRNSFQQFQTDFVMPNNPLYIEYLDKCGPQEADLYEQYCLKQYCPSKCLVSSVAYRPARLEA